MKKWKLIKDYAIEKNLTVQAIYYRINKKLIPEHRVRKAESGKIEIREE